MIARQRAGGAVVALVGALGVTASGYLDWYGGQDATDFPLERLFQTDASEQASSYWNSMAIALAVVSALALLGALLLSRSVLGLGWLIGLAALVLWVVMQSADEAVDFSVGDIQAGGWVCTAALLVMLVGIAGMGGRHPSDVAGATTPAEPHSSDV